ncbi:19417_t:CDS:2, partial [Dentiscutata erythropus]
LPALSSVHIEIKINVAAKNVETDKDKNHSIKCDFGQIGSNLGFIVDHCIRPYANSTTPGSSQRLKG